MYNGMLFGKEIQTLIAFKHHLTIQREQKYVNMYLHFYSKYIETRKNKKINVRKILAFIDLFRTDGNVRFFHFFFDHILIAWPRFQNLRCHEIRSDYYPDAFLLSLFAVDFNAFNFKLEEARFQGYSKMPSKFP